jgi:hypothetical protein
MSIHRYLPAAHNLARLFPNLLAEKGLNPPINRFILTESANGDAWFFVVLNESAVEFPVSFGDSGVLSHLSTALRGRRVMFSNSYGLCYAVLLSTPDNRSNTLPDREHSLLN